jgi:hypothetical protein
MLIPFIFLRYFRCITNTEIADKLLQWGFECQFQSKSKKRGPRSPYVTGLEKRCKDLEKLLRKYTNDIPKEQSIPKSDDEMSDDQNGDMEEANAHGSDDKELSPQPSATHTIHRQDASKSFSAQDLQEQFSQISLENCDTIKYTGSSAGLRVLNKSLFKDGQVLWPGRQNVVLQMSPQDEVVVLKTDLSESGSPQIKMGIGIGMQMGIFESNTKGWSPDTACRKNCLYMSMLDRHVTLDERKKLVDA